MTTTDAEKWRDEATHWRHVANGYKAVAEKRDWEIARLEGLVFVLKERIAKEGL